MRSVKKWANVRLTLVTLALLIVGSVNISEPAYAITKRGRERDIGAILELAASHTDEKTKAIVNDTETAKKAFLNVLTEAYGKRMVEIKSNGVVAGEYMKNPNDIIFVGAQVGVDHVIEITGKILLKDFDKGKKETDYKYDFLGKVRIIDLATIKIVSDQELKWSGKGSALNKVGDETLLMAPYEAIANDLVPKLSAAYNPNVMEAMNRKKIADYFFTKDQCERAAPIYDKAVLEKYDFDVLDEMQKRIDHCSHVIGQKNLLQAKYKFELEYHGVSPTYQAYFKNAADRLQLAQAMNHYSDKPVKIKITYAGESAEQTGAPGEILLNLVYDPARFPVIQKSHVTETQGLIDLTAFDGPTLQLVKFKAAAVQGMPNGRRELFSQFALKVLLNNYAGDSATYLVNVNNQNHIMGPKSLEMVVAGFQPTKIEQTDDGARQKNQIVLGPGYTIEGKPTTSQVVYRFFGFKTK